MIKRRSTLSLILTGIHSLAQHIHQLNINPEQYRPRQCCHCGWAVLWCHGSYSRYPDRSPCAERKLNPVSISRFRCARRECRRSCSVLPECIAPRRWYLWSVQQAMLILLLTGNLCVEHSHPHVRTVWRWWARLKERFDIQRFHLCGQDAFLGQYTTVAAFWQACFLRRSLSKAMLIIHQQGACIP